MGISNGSETLYHLTGLTRADVAAVACGLFYDAKDTLYKHMNLPTIDCDTNNVVENVVRKSSSKSEAVAKFYHEWALCWLHVVPVVDGEIRPVCKQASKKRRSDREKERIEGFRLLKEAKKIRLQHSNGHAVDGGDDWIDAVTKNEKKGRNLIAKSAMVMPSDFTEALEEEIVNGVRARDRNGSGGFVGIVLRAKFQADAVMVDRLIRGQSVMAMTRDSDIPVIAGDEYLAIKDFSPKADGNLTLVSTCKRTLENALKHVPECSENEVAIKDAICPIFENVQSRKLRALMMVACGCDVLEKGIPGVGPRTLKKQMDNIRDKMPVNDRSNEELFYNLLLSHIGDKTKFGNDVVETFVNAILFEPTNYIKCDAGEKLSSVTMDKHTYLQGTAPNILPRYLSDLAMDTTTIENGPEVSTCKGVGDADHLFLAITGQHNCQICNSIVCSGCCGNNGDRTLCLHCLAAESLVPSRDGGYMERILKMRNKLDERFKFDGAHELPPADVEEAYEAAMKSVRNHESLMNDVKYPLYSTSEIKMQSHWKSIYTIQFCKGGTFIADPLLKAHVPAILELFAAFVTYSDEETKHTDWIKDPAIYAAMPSMIIEFTRNSRIDSGYRLERCARHGLDPRMDSMFDNTASIVQLEDGSLGLYVNSKVPASMKKDVYDVSVVHTATDLLACECSCNCKIGSKGDDRVVCVHICPLPYKVTELLLEDLSEHILLELTPCLSSLSDSWSEETMQSVKKSVITLMEAAGETISGKDKREATLTSLMECFLTGTEKTKSWGRKTGKRLMEPGPMELLNYSSPAYEAKERKNQNKLLKCEQRLSNDEANNVGEPELEPNPDNDTTETPQTPNYIKTSLMLHASGFDASKMPQIGWRLLSHRAQEQMQQMDLSEVMSLRERLAKEWNELVASTDKRSIRQSETQLANLGKKRRESGVQDAASQTPKKRRTVCCVTPSPPNTRSTAKSETKRPLTRQGMELPVRPPKAKPPKPSKRCSRAGCKVTNISHPTTKFHRIKKYPKPLAKSARLSGYIKREGNILLREETLDRSYFNRDVKTVITESVKNMSLSGL
jgi:hypothetical protein